MYDLFRGRAPDEPVLLVGAATPPISGRTAEHRLAAGLEYGRTRLAIRCSRGHSRCAQNLAPFGGREPWPPLCADPSRFPGTAARDTAHMRHRPPSAARRRLQTYLAGLCRDPAPASCPAHTAPAASLAPTLSGTTLRLSDNRFFA